MLVIFDLDGTLALTEHRAHFLQQQPKDWRGFYAACDQDLPNVPIIETLHALWRVGHKIEIWSGRSDEVAGKTADWLRANYLWQIGIRMRAAGDHRPDTVLKAEWLDEIGSKPDLVFEDRDSMVAMYRSRGIVCCQVAPGAF
jgi:FMN phosphatase YigB (HAD superfamily)